MYYRDALQLQFFLEFAGDNSMFFNSILLLSRDSESKLSINLICLIYLAAGGYRNMDLIEKEKKAFFDRAQALVDLKFTYVVSCQVYGAQKKSDDPRDRSCYSNILNLMLTWVRC